MMSIIEKWLKKSDRQLENNHLAQPKKKKAENAAVLCHFGTKENHYTETEEPSAYSNSKATLRQKMKCVMKQTLREGSYLITRFP